MVITSADMLENYNIWNSVNLIPFKTIGQYTAEIIKGSMRGHAIRNLAGNLLLFFPAGFYLPFFMRKMHKLKNYSITLAALIIAVEFIQVLTMTGSFDIDDFILNLAGAIIGFVIFTRTPVCCARRSAAPAGLMRPPEDVIRAHTAVQILKMLQKARLGP